MLRPHVNFPLVVLVATVVGLVLGLSAIAYLELTVEEHPAAPADPVVDLLDLAPTGATRDALLATLHPELVAAFEETPARKRAAVDLLARIGSGRLLLEVEESLGLRRVERARERAATDPLAVGEQVVAQLERGWLPPGTRRASTSLLWELLDAHGRALVPARALRWAEAALEHGDPGALRGDVALGVLASVVEAGMLPGPDGLPSLGPHLARVREALRGGITEADAAVLDRLLPLAAGQEPPELTGVRLRELADDDATPETWRAALRAAQTAVTAAARLQLDGDAEGALRIIGDAAAEPLPGAAALRARIEARRGNVEGALRALEPWTRPGVTLAPELRRRAARLLRRQGRLGEAEALLPPDLMDRLQALERARADARRAARAANGQLADLRLADARALVDALDWATEAMLLELARADLKPSRAAHHVGRALPLVEAASRAATTEERTPGRLCSWAMVLARAPEARAVDGAAREEGRGVAPLDRAASSGSAGAPAGPSSGQARADDGPMYGAAAAAALLEEASRVEGAADLDLVGRCALRLGLRDDARALLERAFERATTLDLRSRVAYHRFTAAETLEDAMEWAKRAEQLGAGDAAGLMLEAQAQLYARRGQLGDACQILDALIGGTAAGKDDAASLVDVASYHRSRYDCRGDLDDLETAATMLRHAAVLDDGPVVLANQADVLAHAGLVRLLGTGLDTRGLALSSSRPEFLELLAMGGSRQAVLKAARSSPELVEAVALYELLVRRSAADDDQLDWLVRWYELHGSADDLERLGRELPPREPLLVAPCTADPSCVAVLRDGWKRARRIVERAAFTDPRTRAAAAVLLAAAARDVAPVAADGDEPLALAETTLRRSLGRERWSEVALALAQVLVAQVAAGEAASGRQLPPLWPLLAEVEQLRAIGAPADPRLTEAAELVRGAVAAGAPAGRLDARLVALVSEEEGAELLEAWASRPGVLEARAVAAALAPGDPSAVLALADALLGVGEPDDARRVLDDARELGLPIPAALNLD